MDLRKETDNWSRTRGRGGNVGKFNYWQVDPHTDIPLFRPPDGCRKIQPSVIRECRKIQYPEVFALDLRSFEQQRVVCQFLAEPTNS